MDSSATRFRSAASGPFKRSAPSTPKRGAIAGAKMGLRPPTTPGVIRNRAAETKVLAAYKRSAVQGGRRRQPTVGPAPARGYVVTGRPLGMAFKKDVPPSAPNPSLEPPSEPQTELSQPKPQCPTPMEESRYAPTKEMLYRAFSHVILEPGDLDVEDGDDANWWSSYVKDIYKYLRYLEENKSVKCKYLGGQEMDRNMLAVVIDWLPKIHMKFNLQEESLFMTAAITDHFLQVDSKQYVLAKYLMELSTVDYYMDHFPPSGFAAAAFSLPLKFLNGCGLLPSLQPYMFYPESDILPIKQYMAKSVVLTRSLRDEMKQRLTEYSAALRGGQTTLLDQATEEKHLESTIENLQINNEETQVSLWNKILALQRIQLMAALRKKVDQDDRDSCPILETVNHIVLLSKTILKYQQQAREKKQKLLDIKRKRLSLKRDQGRKLQQIQTMKKKQKKEKGNMNLVETKMLQNLEKEREMTTIIQNVFQNIIIGSGINWAEDPSLKAIVLQLEKSVHLP